MNGEQQARRPSAGWKKATELVAAPVNRIDARRRLSLQSLIFGTA